MIRMKPEAHTSLDGVFVFLLKTTGLSPPLWSLFLYFCLYSLPWLWEHSNGHSQRPCFLSQGLGQSSELPHGYTV